MIAHRLMPTPDDDFSDRDLADVAVAQRNRAGFSTLYERYAVPRYRYCYRRLGNHELAEDATSQIFMKALAGIKRFDPDRGTFRSWLFTIADRVVIDSYRRRRDHVPIEIAADLPARDSSPEDVVFSNEEGRQLQAFLIRLTPDQQRIIALRLAGLTGPEIALVIGREHNAVKSLQFRAFHRLRRLFAESEGDRDV